MNLITAGGGGAYVHGTYSLKREIKFKFNDRDLNFRLDRKLEPNPSSEDAAPKQTTRSAVYPTKTQSFRTALNILRFPRDNVSFFIAAGILYWLMTWTFANLRVDAWIDIPPGRQDHAWSHPDRRGREGMSPAQPRRPNQAAPKPRARQRCQVLHSRFDRKGFYGNRNCRGMDPADDAVLFLRPVEFHYENLVRFPQRHPSAATGNREQHLGRSFPFWRSGRIFRGRKIQISEALSGLPAGACRPLLICACISPQCGVCTVFCPFPTIPPLKNWPKVSRN